jgi:hypothetical protein
MILRAEVAAHCVARFHEQIAISFRQE